MAVDAPAAIGPYSQAVVLGDLVFVSGCVAFHPETGQIVEGGIEAQTGRALENLGAIVKASGSSIGQIVKTTVRVSRRLSLWDGNCLR
jgi:2-iminobutanoate/2-iminopropanoate deaminase